jgi:hypothetical protein
VDEQVTEYEGETPDTSTDSEPSRQQKRALVRRLHKMVKRSKSAEARYKERCVEGLEYYFRKQWKDEDKKILEDRGQPVITINRIRPTTRLVHGLIVAQPVDWRAKPVGKNDDNLAEIGSAALKFAANQDVLDYPSLRSRVYWWSLVYGVGVAMVGLGIRNKDPRTEPVQAIEIDPREFGVDPQSRDLLIKDARWCKWTRKVDLEDAQAQYQEWAEPLAKLAKRAADLNKDVDDQGVWEGSPWYATPPVSEWKNLDDWNQADEGDADASHKQVVLHEIWEKVPEPAWLAEFADATIEFDPNTPEGVELLNRPDLLRYYEDTVPKVYYHVLCGNLLLKSEPSPYKHGQLPFVTCYHERDENGDPYSFVEDLKDPQREINHRRSKALNETTNPNVRVSPDTLAQMGLDADGFAEAWNKGGMVVMGGVDAITVYERTATASAQFDLMQDSKQEIQSVSGANDDLMGYNSSSKSGIAKQVQMQQGATMQRPNEANLRAFDKRMGELVFQLIQQAHTDEWVVRITDKVGADKYITLNKQTVDPETGRMVKLNDISQARYEVEIDAQPWSPTARETAAQQVGAMAEGEMDPVIRTALKRAAIEIMDMPEKGKIMEIYDRAVEMMMGGGQQPDPAQMELQQRGMAAEVASKEADAAKKGAEAVKIQSETQLQAQQAAMMQAAPMMSPL